MFSGMDNLMSDPQMKHWYAVLLWLLGGLVTGILLADSVLFFRWVLYQARIYNAPPQILQPPIPLEPVNVPTPEASGEFAELSPETESLPTAAVPEEEPASFLRPPFAPRWSLAHVFVAGQIVLLTVNVLAILVVVPFMALAYFHAKGDMAALQGPSVQRATLYVTIGSLFVQNVFFVYVAAFLFRRYGTSLREVGLRRPTAREIQLGLTIGIALLVVSNGAEFALGKLLEVFLPHATMEKFAKFSSSLGAGALFTGLNSNVLKALFLIGGAVAAPIGEEVFFRGLLYNALKNRFGIAVGIVVSGFLFALVHISPIALLIIFPMGMLLAYVYEKTRSLWVTILMHAVNNGVALAIAWIFPKFGS